MRNVIRIKHLSLRTERSYLDWVLRFRASVNDRSPDLLTRSDVLHFLSALAVDRGVSAATQNQAFFALLFFFQNVLGQNLADLAETVRATRSLSILMIYLMLEARFLWHWSLNPASMAPESTGHFDTEFPLAGRN